MTYKEFLNLGKVEYGVQSNCSEATIRIRTDGQKPGKVDALVKELDRRLNMVDSEPSTGDWDDEITDDPWSEGYVNQNNIFGVNMIEITGDAPFNYGDQIIEVIKQYLPDADLEFKEP